VALGDLVLPAETLRLTLGLGSAAARRPTDPPGRIWAITDRGPNIKIPMAVDRFGLTHLARLVEREGAKVLPRPDLGPTLAELIVHEDRVELVRTLRLRMPDGRPVAGAPLPCGTGTSTEPAFDIEGAELAPDHTGADTEGLVALSDGSFWASEEYGPSLLKMDAEGVVMRRLVPQGSDLPDAEPVLPQAALRRRLNRGFEGLAISPDERWLYVALQSGMEDEDPGSAMIWKLDAQSGALAAEHLYGFDAPETFVADAAEGEVSTEDLKVCDLLCTGPDELLVLERISKSSRIYRIRLEQPGKTLVFSSDDGQPVAADLEAMALLSPTEIILVSDNDFGVEGAPTRFFRLTFEEAL